MSAKFKTMNISHKPSNSNNPNKMKLNELLISRSPDITSIIDSFESNKNPINLFIEEKYQDNGHILEDKLNILEKNLDAMNLWINQTFTPNYLHLPRKELNNCMAQIFRIEKKLHLINSTCQNLSSEYRRKIRIDPLGRCKFKVTCGCCQSLFALNNRIDFDELEKHNHVAEILTMGNLCSPISAVDVSKYDSESEIDEETTQSEENEDIDNNEYVCSTNKNNTTEILEHIPKNTNTFLQYCNYNKKIKDKLYPYSLISEVSSHENNYQFYSIQAVASNLYVCLICRDSIISKYNLSIHIKAKKHTNKLIKQRQNIINYHTAFSSLSEDLQIHQINFIPDINLNTNNVYCTVCAISVEISDIVHHIFTKTHKLFIFYRNFQEYYFFSDISHALKSNVSPTIREKSDEINEKILNRNFAKLLSNQSTIFAYDTIIKNTLYEGKIMGFIATVENNFDFYTILKLNSYQYLCIICGGIILSETNLFYHIKESKHLKLLNSKKSAIVNYHTVFSQLPLEYQKHQMYFTIAKKSHGIYCRFCSNTFLSNFQNEIINHLKRKKHRKQFFISKKMFENYYFHEDITNFYKRRPKVEEANEEPENNSIIIKIENMKQYELVIINVLYPDDLMSQVCILESNNTFYSIQVVAKNFEYLCLICRKNLKSRSCVITHVQAKKHSYKITRYDKNVINYHNVFTKLSLELQYHQVLFKPCKREDDSVTCKVCQTQVEHDMVYNHIINKKHKENFLIYINYKRCRSHKYNFHEEILHSFHLLEQSKNEEIPEYNIDIKYNDNVQEKIYPKKLISAISAFEKNNKFYTIQVLAKDAAYFCLLCNNMLVKNCDVVNHVQTKRHLEKLEKNNEGIINYHNAFSSLPYDFQIQQIFFEPLEISNSLIKCKICKITLDKFQLKKHINNEMHMEKLIIHLKLPEYRQNKYIFYDEIKYALSRIKCENIFTLPQYSEEIIKKLYPIEIIQEINKIEKYFDYFTIQTLLNNQKYLCLVCGQERSHQYIFLHVETSTHQEKLSLIKKELPKYHNFFVNLSPELQMYQILFIINSNGLFHCKICNTSHEEIEVLNHINSISHKKIYLDYVYNNKKVLNFHFYEKVLLSVLDNTLISNDIKNDTLPPEIKQENEENINSLDIKTEIPENLEIKQEYKIMRQYPYSEKVLKLLYPSEKMQLFCSLEENFTFFSIQILSNHFQCICLLCKCKFSNEKNLISHVKGENHMEKLIHHFGDCLYYHYSFSILEPEYQIHQVLFQPSALNDHLIMCKICLINLNDLQIKDHIRNEEHRKKSFLYIKSTLFGGQKFYFYDEILLDLMKIQTDCTNISLENKENIYENSCNLTIHQNKTNIQGNSSKNEADNETENNVLKNNLPSHPYDPIVKQLIYPFNVVKRVCKLENNYEFYTIQAVAKNPPRFYCLLCKKDLPSRNCVEAHATSFRHNANIAKSEKISRVIEYHNAFSKLPSNLQIFQVVFHTASLNVSETMVFCIVCSQSIEGNDIANHIYESAKHKKKFLRKKYSKYIFYSEMEHILTEATINNTLISQETQYSNTTIENNENESVSESDEVLSETSSKSQSIIFDENVPHELSVPSRISPTKIKDMALKKLSLNGSPKRTDNLAKIKHTIIPSFKESVGDVFDLIENRFRKYFEYIHTDGDNCICTICQISFLKNNHELKKHFVSEKHKINAAPIFGNQKYSFYCDLCFKYFATDKKWSDHLICAEHRQRTDVIHKTIPKGGLYKEYECVDCVLVMYGNKTSWSKHINGNFGIPKKRKKAKAIKLNAEIERYLKNEKDFNTLIFKLAKESADVLNSQNLNIRSCKGIETALQPIFIGKVTAYPFGSRISGLGNLVSDLDVFVDVGDMYFGLDGQDSETQANLVMESARALKKHKDFADVCPIPMARTPIVQAVHKVTGLDCDISFRHGLSVENTEFLRLCIDVQPKLKLLILFLKKWISLNNLKEKISTYAISMMSIFFMQKQRFLPSLKQIREIDPTESSIIAGWETFCFQKSLSELNILYPACSQNLKNILRDYFEFYTKFNFQKEVICPLLGYSVMKADFSEDRGRRLPIEMKAYVDRINESTTNEVFKITTLCIQDPFDLSHNLTKACNDGILTKMIELSKQSLALLDKTNV